MSNISLESFITGICNSVNKSKKDLSENTLNSFLEDFDVDENDNNLYRPKKITFDTFYFKDKVRIYLNINKYTKIDNMYEITNISLKEDNNIIIKPGFIIKIRKENGEYNIIDQPHIKASIINADGTIRNKNHLIGCNKKLLSGLLD